MILENESFIKVITFKIISLNGADVFKNLDKTNHPNK